MSIETVDDLRSHLVLATRVELSTIPPYLYAMYSIEDQESEAARLIASVVVEEMLHVALITNLLLAVGGEPSFRYDLIPSYPGFLAHHQPDLLLELRECTPELIEGTFLEIEKPRAPGAIPEDDNFETLGSSMPRWRRLWMTCPRSRISSPNTSQDDSCRSTRGMHPSNSTPRTAGVFS